MTAKVELLVQKLWVSGHGMTAVSVGEASAPSLEGVAKPQPLLTPPAPSPPGARLALQASFQVGGHIQIIGPGRFDHGKG